MLVYRVEQYIVDEQTHERIEEGIAQLELDGWQFVQMTGAGTYVFVLFRKEA